MKIKVMSYEECREDFFVKLIKHAENKIKYWKRQRCYRCEIEENLSNAGAEISYCQDALNALEKQIRKKPKVLKIHDISYYKYGDCECGEHIMDDEKYCSNCGQALDWSEEE